MIHMPTGANYSNYRMSSNIGTATMPGRGNSQVRLPDAAQAPVDYTRWVCQALKRGNVDPKVRIPHKRKPVTFTHVIDKLDKEHKFFPTKKRLKAFSRLHDFTRQMEANDTSIDKGVKKLVLAAIVSRSRDCKSDALIKAQPELVEKARSLAETTYYDEEAIELYGHVAEWRPAAGKETEEANLKWLTYIEIPNANAILEMFRKLDKDPNIKNNTPVHRLLRHQVQLRINSLLTWLEQSPDDMQHRFAVAAAASELSRPREDGTLRNLCHEAGYRVLEAMENASIDDTLKPKSLKEIFDGFLPYFNLDLLEQHVVIQADEASKILAPHERYDSVSMLVALKQMISNRKTFVFPNVMPSLLGRISPVPGLFLEELQANLTNAAISYIDKFHTRTNFEQYLVQRSGWTDALKRDYKKQWDAWLITATAMRDDMSTKLDEAFSGHRIIEPQYRKYSADVVAAYDKLANDVLAKMTHALVGAFWKSSGDQQASTVSIAMPLTRARIEQSEAFRAFQSTCWKVESHVQKHRPESANA
jgi:hypothetical protein